MTEGAGGMTGRGWIPDQVRDDKGENVIPAQAGIQGDWIPGQARDDRVPSPVIPADAGIQDAGSRLSPKASRLGRDDRKKGRG